MNLIIEVIKNHDRPLSRTFNQGTDKERTVFKQKAYMYTGSPFPIEIENTFNSLAECLEVGKYIVSPSSFKAGRYGDIELDRFNLVFEKFNENNLSKVG
ncbi:G5P family DNA-binding protein [Colwellia sp. E2M01]|uniref:G5P family DNA-binding protein n=1 Tax=Colwellia sp. E2M01 TaxID=2841561 RepID=UPI001C080260|nr:G5P family DNA-binding protein [Colwellia sp. E2M01]MBU2871529.1 G5P family DNA-binding protein [Colwellia sp. E2M01]